MNNLLEYSENYEETTASLWNYYRDEPRNPLSTNSESLKYKTSITKTSITGNAYNAGKVGKNETAVVIPLKHLSDF